MTRPVNGISNNKMPSTCYYDQTTKCIKSDQRYRIGICSNCPKFGIVNPDKKGAK